MEILLGALLDGVLSVIWHRIRLPIFNTETPASINLLDRVLYLTIALCLFNSLAMALFGLWAILDDGIPSRAGDRIYDVVVLLVPFFNLGAIVGVYRRPFCNPRRLGAAIGMIVSANLPVWVVWGFWDATNSDDPLRLLVPCLLAFILSVILFILPVELPLEAKRDELAHDADRLSKADHAPDKPQKPGRRVRRPAPTNRFIREPEFLDSDNQPKNT